MLVVFGDGMGKKNLDDFLSHILVSCGDSGDKYSDPRMVIEKCCEVGALMNAYAVVLYLLNNAVGIPKVYLVPPNYVPNITNICIINPETLISMDVENFGIPVPQSINLYVLSKVEGSGEDQDEREEPIEIVVPSIFGVCISYFDFSGKHNSSAVIFIHSQAINEYVALLPPDQFKEEMVKVCGTHSQKRIFEMSRSELMDLQSRSSLIRVKEVKAVSDGEYVDIGNPKDAIKEALDVDDEG